MSDTPRTDAMVSELQYEAPHPALVDHARQLERELAFKIELLDGYRAAYRELTAAIDEAVNAAEKIK